jgi:hypothetical protein
MMDPEGTAHLDVIFYYSVNCIPATCVCKAIHESNGRLKRANSLTFCQCDLGADLRLQLPNRFGLKMLST